MATTPNRWTANLAALAVALAACGPCVTPRMAPGPPVDETRPVATHDPAADDPWLHTRGTPTPAPIEPGGVHDR
jgi:hypothetical protein